MKIWTVTYNDDGGVMTEVYNTLAAAEAARTDWLQSYARSYPSVDFSTWNDEIFDQLCEMPGFMDSITVDEHDVHPPAHEPGSLEAIMIDFVPGRSDGDLEVDDNAIVSWGDDAGAYVQCWKWVSFSDVDHPLAIQVDNLTWHFDLFEEFMLALPSAPKGWKLMPGTLESLGLSEGSNDHQEFEARYT